jgi:hypothetical protein
MKTIRRTAWPWLLLAVICWCGNGCQKTLEVHYVQIEACQTWSDQDNPNVVFPTPLGVFRLVSVKNTSARGTPNITFDLQHVFFNNDGVQEHPESSTGIPEFRDIGLTLVPGQSVHFPEGQTRGLFAIQVFFGRTEDVRGLEFLLQYDPRTPPTGGSPDEKVFMVRDPFPSTFQPFCDKAALSALQ